MSVIPANLIIGYLGTGKTTAIRHLLHTKPGDQRWGVIVNEFGEVGVDHILLSTGEGTGKQGSKIIEVPGGCVCCSATLPGRQALEHLIAEQQLDRILIEPTGLAHPRNVVALFGGEQFADILTLQATVALVDPWYFEYGDYAKLDNYELQMALADVLVANKCDKVNSEALQAFREYSRGFQPPKSKVAEVQFGKLDWQWLTLPQSVELSEQDPVQHVLNGERRSFEREGLQRKESAFEGAYTGGWLLEHSFCFDADKLHKFLRCCPVTRVKGILQTDRGWVLVNRMADDWEWRIAPPEVARQWRQSRLEMLSANKQDWPYLEDQLCSCLKVETNGRTLTQP